MVMMNVVDVVKHIGTLTHNVIWLYAGGAKYQKTFNLPKILLKARKMGLNANPHLRKTNVSSSFDYDVRKRNKITKGLDACLFN